MRKPGFDNQRFMRDVEMVIVSRGMTRKQAAFEIGIHDATMSRIRLYPQRRPDAISLLALSVWSGIDPRDYFVDHESQELENHPVKERKRYEFQST